MTVAQLIQALSHLPQDASVLLESDTGYSPLGGVDLISNAGGLPDEVLLQPDGGDGAIEHQLVGVDAELHLHREVEVAGTGA